MTTLTTVISLSKTRILRKRLEAGYRMLASMGHVGNLPLARTKGSRA